MRRDLVREAIVKNWRCRFGHDWAEVDGIAGFWGLVSQCDRCNTVRVFFPLTMTEHRGSHEMLVSS